jgi:hypothetical protein
MVKKGETMLKLDLDSIDEAGSKMRDRIENAYERIAGSDDYRKNDNNLRLIQICVITVVMVS